MEGNLCIWVEEMMGRRRKGYLLTEGPYITYLIIDLPVLELPGATVVPETTPVVPKVEERKRKCKW